MGMRTLIFVMLLLLVVLVDCFKLDMLRSLPKNVSGYLINRNGKYYVQPIFVNRSNSSSSSLRQEDQDQVENESHGNDEESWNNSDKEKDESGLAQTTLAVVEIEDSTDENDIDDGLTSSWEMRKKSWWQRWLEPDTRFRGFSIYGMFESAVGMVFKFFGGMIFENENDEIDYKDSATNYKGHQLLRTTPRSKKQVKYLQVLRDSEPDDIRFWSVPAKDRPTDILVSPTLLNDVKEYLREKKVNYVMLISDLEKAIKTQNPRMPKERRQDLFSSQGHAMTWKRYHRYKDVMDYLNYLAAKYPQIVEVMSIGKSYEGRALKIVKISTGANRNGESKPAIWIDAGMHAREWISIAVATYILNQLVEKNENYTRLLDLSDWVIMPIANPDGYEYTHTNDRLWRKTRSLHDSESEYDEETRQAPGLFHMVNRYTQWLFGRSCEGVDPNRNFNIHWGDEKIGANKDPCSDTYQGPSPFSEPETRAISNYIMKNKKHIRTYLTLHSYSQMLLVPYGFTRVRPVDFDDLMNVANKAKKAIAKVNGIEYAVGGAASLLYPTSGSADDWAKAVAGLKYAYTMELRDKGSYGFLLPASQIIPTARETWAGVRILARMAATNSNS